MQQNIIVIGGGMAGTSAAHTLSNLGYNVTILEKNNRLGGRIHSVAAGGTTFDMGAGFMTNAYTNLLAFSKSQGLDKKLYQQHGNSGVFRGNDVTMASLGTLRGNGILPFGAKLQAMTFLGRVIAHWHKLDVHAPWKAYKLDKRPVSELFTGKSGEKLIEYAIYPILNGYCYWTPEQTSEAMLLSIGKAAFKGGSYKMRGGLQQLPEAAAHGSKILLSHSVTSVKRTDKNTYEVLAERNGKQMTLQADGIVCATTASVISDIFAGLTDTQKSFFGSIRYSAAALIAQTYPGNKTLGARGIAFPRKENDKLAAITVSPEPSTLKPLSTVKVYASGTMAQKLLTMPDDQVASELAKEALIAQKAVFTSEATPLTTAVQKWPEALPVFSHGYYHQLKDFADGKIESPSEALVFAGDYLGGPLMEGAFTSGKLAAERLHKRLGSPRERA